MAREFDVLAVQSGYPPDPATMAVAVPIHRTRSHAFDNTRQASTLNGGLGTPAGSMRFHSDVLPAAC